MRCATKTEAQKELRKFLHAADCGMLPERTLATVGHYLDWWLDTARDKSPKTLERYREIAKCQITPHLGAEQLQKLRPDMIRDWHVALVDKGLSPRTVHHAHRLLRQVLDHAVKDGKLARNVADVHAPPKVGRQEIEIIEPDHIAAVLAALQGHSLYPIVALALASGMRRGELLALQWGDVDLDRATIQVKRSLEETKEKGLRLKGPKSDAGRRSITLPAVTVVMLRDHKIEAMEFRLAVGAGKLEPEHHVFTDVQGGPLKPHTVSRAWHRIVEAKALPCVSFHALRHTHASMLIAEGMDVLTISRRLGHSKASLTLDVYGHLVGGADARAAEAIGKVLK